jgi:hypothetical protein
MLNHESVMMNLFQHLFRADFLAYLLDIPINIGHFGNFDGMRQIRNIKGGSFDPPFMIYALSVTRCQPEAIRMSGSDHG